MKSVSDIGAHALCTSVKHGMPLVVASSEIMDNLGQGFFGGTYGGNAISSAAASATIDILARPEIKTNVNEMGDYLKSQLIREPLIREVRQYGLMIAIEFHPTSDNRAIELVASLREEGILVLLSGDKSQYVRLLPPLNISKVQIDLFLETFSRLLNKST